MATQKPRPIECLLKRYGLAETLVIVGRWENFRLMSTKRLESGSPRRTILVRMFSRLHLGIVRYMRVAHRRGRPPWRIHALYAFRWAPRWCLWRELLILAVFNFLRS